MKTIKITNFGIDGLTVKTYRLFWEINKLSLDTSINDYYFQIYRSGSIKGPWDIIAGEDKQFRDVYEYFDVNVLLHTPWPMYYYIIRLYDNDDKLVDETYPFTLEYPPDCIAKEIIYRNNLLLKQYNGVPVFALQERTFGDKCDNCWDPISMRPTKVDCEVCYGTGWKGGYFNPHLTLINFSPMVEQNTITPIGEMVADQLTAWTTNMPVFKVRDLLIDKRNVRYRVVNVNSTRKGRALVHQILTLALVTISEPAYLIDITQQKWQHIFVTNNFKALTERNEKELIVIDPEFFRGFTYQNGEKINVY